MHVLVKYKDNYADEFNVEGYELFNEFEWNRTDVEISLWFKNHGSYVFYFGTNEAMDYESEEDFRETLTIEYLNDQEVETTFLYLPHKFGIVPYFHIFGEC